MLDEHQVDSPVAIQVVPVHPELDSVVRQERDVDAPRERGAAIGCWRAKMHLVSCTLAGDACALQRDDYQVGSNSRSDEKGLNF